MDVTSISVKTYNHYSQLETIGSNCSVYFDYAADPDGRRIIGAKIDSGSASLPTVGMVYTGTSNGYRVIFLGDAIADTITPGEYWTVVHELDGAYASNAYYVGTDGSVVTTGANSETAVQDRAVASRWFHFHGNAPVPLDPVQGYRLGRQASAGESLPVYTDEKLVIISVIKLSSVAAQKLAQGIVIGDHNGEYNSGKFIGMNGRSMFWGTGGAVVGEVPDGVGVAFPVVTENDTMVIGLVKDGETVKFYKDGVLVDSGTASGYGTLTTDPLLGLNFQEGLVSPNDATAYGNGHVTTTRYGDVIYTVSTAPSDNEMNAAMLWCKDKWIAGEKVLYPGFINK